MPKFRITLWQKKYVFVKQKKSASVKNSTESGVFLKLHLINYTNINDQIIVLTQKKKKTKEKIVQNLASFV